MKDCMKGLMIIMFAILIALIRNAVIGSFAIFEWLIIFPLIFTPGLYIIIFLHSYENGVICGCFGIIYSIYCFLQPWLYWTRTFQGLNPDCDPQYFIYVFIDLYNPSLIKFFRAMAIISCIFGVAVAGVSVYFIFRCVFQSDEKLRELDDNHQNFYDSVLWKTARILASIMLLFSGVNIIVFTEKMLIGNDVDLSDANFESTSQLIPFLVGLFNFVTTLYGSLKHQE